MPVKRTFLKIQKIQWKESLAAFFLLAVFVLMVCFPTAASLGASQGLLLWFQVLIPSLLPFFLLSGFLIRSGLITNIGTALQPLLGRCFHTSPEGAACVLIGFLCGYPLGARTAADLYARQKISRQEATYLLCLTNNISPGFLSGFVITSCFRRRELFLPALFCVYGLPVICSRLLRRQLSTQNVSHAAHSTQPADLSFSVIDETIRSSLASMAMLGGYVILFRMGMQFLFAVPVSVHTKTALAGILEITSGIPMIVANAASVERAFPAVMAALAFGGLSGLAQTQSVLSETDLPIRRYVLWKLFLAGLAWGCASLYCTLAL